MKTFFKPLKPAALFLFLFLAAGISAGNALPENKTAVLWLMTALSVILCLTVCFNRKKAFFILLGLVFSFGFFSIQSRLFPDLPPHHISHYLDSEKAIITGRVVSFAKHYSRKRKITLSCQTLTMRHHEKKKVTGRIHLNLYRLSEKPPGFGDIVAFKASVKSIRNFMNPGAFDYERFLKLKGIFGTAYADTRNVTILTPGAQTGFFLPLIRKIERVRNQYYYFVLNRTGDSDTGEILASLVTGKKETLSSDIRDLFSKAGISHLLAISGLHLSIVGFLFFSFFYWVFSFLPQALISGRSKKMAGVLTLVPLTGYAVFTGFSPATQRAFLMVTILLFSFISEREKDIVSSLSVAGILILLLDSAALFSISFQLSFMAVVFIIYGVSLASKVSFFPKSKMVARTGGMIWVTLFAGMGTFPLAAHYFNIVSAIAPVSNLIFIPVIGFIILPLGLVSCLCFSYLPGVATVIIHVCHALISFSVTGAEILTSLPFSWSRVNTWDWVCILVIYLMFAALFLLLKGRRRSSALLLATGLVMLTVMFSNDLQEKTEKPGLRITVMDVGQGSSALIQTPEGKTILVDGGGFSDTASFDTGRYIIAPFLWRKKIQCLDYVILSHPESDHLNGLIFILENFLVGSLIKNQDEKKSRNYRRLVETCLQRNIRIWSPSQISLKETVLLFFDSGNHEDPKDFNNNSLVFKLMYKDFSMLFSGDILTDREERLAGNEKIDLCSDILLCPHHGSSSSSSKFFLDKVRPKSVIVSCGRYNKYDFPHSSVLKRYGDMGIPLFRTDENGAIFISSDGRDHHIKTSKGG